MLTSFHKEFCERAPVRTVTTLIPLPEAVFPLRLPRYVASMLIAICPLAVVVIVLFRILPVPPPSVLTAVPSPLKVLPEIVITEPAWPCTPALSPEKLLPDTTAPAPLTEIAYPLWLNTPRCIVRLVRAPAMEI